MFGTTNNDNASQGAPAMSATGDDSAATTSTDQVPMTSDAPSYLPSVPSADSSTSVPSDDATAALDNLAADPEELTSDNETPDSSSAPSAPASTPDDLLQLKQQALQQLTPLVGHLEQSAEDRFRTYMMMIQAADNKDLITEAYKAAEEIEDEKVRAQALLDVVNEINYFTQKQEESKE